MSRAFIACSLFFAFASTALADRGEPHFAQPPQAPHVRIDLDKELVRPAPRLDRDTVRAALVQQRHANLARFRAYQQKGVFPNNTFGDRKLNVWRDDAGNFCAAATMIKVSGADSLVSTVAVQSNFIRLADVSQGPLMDWILTSGLTQDEVAAIQEPFLPVEKPQPVVAVDAKLRKAEDARLRAVYSRVDRAIVRNEKQSLELAVDRLMTHPRLAWQLVGSIPTT